MVAIFAASPITCFILFSTLEVGKLVAAQWLHGNWHNNRVTFLHKAYMVIAVVVLMVITAFGIYGFLAKGHLEQEAPIEGIALQIAQKEQAIKMADTENTRLAAKVEQLDANISSFLKGDKADRANTVRRSQRAERLEIEKEIKTNNDKIKVLNDELLTLKVNSSNVTAKLGPIKFVAELFGWEDTGAAVRMLILMVMIAFDPLAVVLLLSGFITLAQWRETRAKKVEPDVIAPPVVSEPTPEPTPEPVEEPAVEEPVAEETPIPEPALELQPLEVQEAAPLIDIQDITDTVVEAPPTPVEEPQAKKPRKKRVVKSAEQKALEKVADDYRTKPLETDADQLIKILEKRPDLLENVIEVIREDAPTVDIPQTEVMGTKETKKAPKLQTNVSQEEIDANLRTPNTWLSRSNTDRNK